jgi:U3 small nucleolar RNA-associated protein 15
VFDSTSRVILRQLKAHKVATHVARWSPDKTHVLTGSDDVTARWWDVTMGEEICRWVVVKYSVVVVLVSCCCNA